MSDNTVILEVNDLHKSYGDHEVLKGISTTIKKGDVLALIGPSGCGKSTFLRSLNLLEVPTSGHVLFEGTDMTDASVDINHVREKIGMVFQQFNLFERRTALDNVKEGLLVVKKLSDQEATNLAKEELAKVPEPCGELDAVIQVAVGCESKRYWNPIGTYRVVIDGTEYMVELEEETERFR